MMRRGPISVVLLILAGCSLAGRSRDPSSAVSGSEATPAGLAAPAMPAPREPSRQYRLGGAASALVTQAHARAAAGDYPAATATLERALRIEPDNPLAWTELGRVQLAAGNAAQADNMGHKALALASGDPSAQAAAWRLIADALRAQRRNQEAVSASARAEALVPQ
jgi:tetratricopeptide (TPR) repeat protein